MGRKKKTLIVDNSVAAAASPAVVAATNPQLDPLQTHTKLVRRNAVKFSQQYDRLIASGWVLVEVRGNIYMFERVHT